MAPQLLKEYLTGSLSSAFTAALFNPFEVVKTRLQLQDMPGAARLYTAGFGNALRVTAAQDGVLGLWGHGLAAIVGRDFFYAGVRTGMYPTVRAAIARGNPDPSLAEKILAGALTGGAGAGLANSFDVVRVRMTAEGGVVNAATGKFATGMRAGHAPRWSSSYDCFADAWRREGLVRGLLLRGVGATMSRAALLTAAQMSTYDHTKVLASRHGLLGEGTALHLAAAGVSGFCAAVACNPADVLKSRLMAARQSQAAGAGTAAGACRAGGVATTMRGTIIQIWTAEGLRGFYRGFLPAYARLGPTIMVQMPLLELLRSSFGLRAI